MNFRCETVNTEEKKLKLLFEASSHKLKFEGEVNHDICWDDISQNKIKKFLAKTKIILDKFDTRLLLKSLNLAKNDKITNAGVLFFAKTPRNFIFHCEMILVAFKGTKGIHIYDRVDIQDDLITQFNEAMIFLRKHLNIRSEIRGVNRYDICEIPLEALREAVINAIIHRDYSMRGTSLMVEVHEDRVVIKNPGGLPSGVSINALTQISIRRNETIADIFSRIDKAERIGSGIKRIMELMQQAKLAQPIIESDIFFSITFKRDPKFKVGGISPEESSAFTANKMFARVNDTFQVSLVGVKESSPKFRIIPINSEESSVLSSVLSSEESSVLTANKMLEELNKNPRVTAKQLANLFGITQRGIEKQLAYLKKQGKIHRIGSNRTGYWEVKK